MNFRSRGDFDPLTRASEAAVAVGSPGVADGRSACDMRSAALNAQIAAHEIGHALVAIALDGRRAVASVTIQPGIGYEGRCIGRDYEEPMNLADAERQDRDFKLSVLFAKLDMPRAGQSRSKKAAFITRTQRACIAMIAGPEAERLFFPDAEPLPTDDHEKARALAFAITSTPVAVDAFVEYCRAEARGIIQTHRHIAQYLTERLVARGTMNGGEIAKEIATAVSREKMQIELIRRERMKRAAHSAAQFTALIAEVQKCLNWKRCGLSPTSMITSRL